MGESDSKSLSEAPSPRITFGIIVLNGEPFTRYCLRSLYPFAHQIIVVEGGSQHAAPSCTTDGHSTDGTLETLTRFKEEEDIEGKVEVVSRSGFWKEKDEQSQAYAERATGDYLWQVDIDEFYRAQDMQLVIDMLRTDPAITSVSFHSLFFWGGLDVRVDGLLLRGGGSVFHRLFRFGQGYRYASHRPPTVVDPEGVNLRGKKWISADAMARRGVYLYHYAQLFPHQVIRKSAYYESLSEGKRKDRAWAERCFMQLQQPYRVHNVYRHLSWLERYLGHHPAEATRMIRDIRAGEQRIELRPTHDVDRLLNSRLYATGRTFLKLISPLYGLGLRLWWRRPWWLSRGGWRQRLRQRESQSPRDT